VVDAAPLFLRRLKGVTEPEQRAEDHRAHVCRGVRENPSSQSAMRFLGQGTLYPDVIESVSIAGNPLPDQTHHNVGGLPARMKLKAGEPLRELFKDEVRQVGRRPRPAEGSGLAPAVPRTRASGARDGRHHGRQARDPRNADAVLQRDDGLGPLLEGLASFAVFLPVRNRRRVRR